MTDDELRKLCEAALPGPWTAFGGGASVGIVADKGDNRLDMDGSVYVASVVHDQPRGIDGYANGKFIAAARDAIPRLLAEKEALVHDIERYVAIAGQQATEIERLYDELRDARAALEQGD